MLSVKIDKIVAVDIKRCMLLAHGVLNMQGTCTCHSRFGALLPSMLWVSIVTRGLGWADSTSFGVHLESEAKPG
jgi:hypothetical protein